MMTKTELKMHLNRLRNLLQEIQFYTGNMTENDFRKNEEVKEHTYMTLQAIGQSAREIDQHYEGDVSLEMPMTVISQLRNSRFNQVMEMNHQQVFGIIKKDLPEIGESVDELIQTLNQEELAQN